MISEDMDYAVRKIVNMRIFSDAEDKMNLSVRDIGGEIFPFPNLPPCRYQKVAPASLQAQPSRIWLVPL